jgi:hypothetical protein
MILEYMYKHLQLHEKCGKLGFFIIIHIGTIPENRENEEREM